jgi:LAS superfamily LD-carboxypeptidase LdcB
MTPKGSAAMFSELEITGRARTHVLQVLSPRFAAHKEAVEAFLAMRESAAPDGFDILPFSSFRDYDTQLRIWNRKYAGKKPLYDADGKPRDFAALSEIQRIECILNWSALPGGSRHQWGTDIDVVDGNAMPEGYAPKLLPEEVQKGGIFAGLHRWLDENMHKFGFFRPYNFYTGGMYPEPWHLSYAPLSMRAIEHVTIDLLRSVTAEADIFGKPPVLELIPWNHENHILNYVRPEEQRPVIAV